MHVDLKVHLAEFSTARIMNDSRRSKDGSPNIASVVMRWVVDTMRWDPLVQERRISRTKIHSFGISPT